MNCSYCGQEARGVCTCGYCMNCIKRYGHNYLGKKLYENRRKDGKE